MNNNVAVFNKDGFTARTITDDNGEIWFVAKDIAEALGYSEGSNTARLFQSVPEFWTEVKRIHLRSENGVEQRREVLCLSEQRLYFFLGRSDKKAALPYQMWVAGEVVPSIRKHGFYATPAKVEEDKPKVIFAESVEASEGSILIGELAKILRQNGVNVGEIRLFKWMRDNGYLCKARGEDWNLPTQRAMDNGLFKIKKTPSMTLIKARSYGVLPKLQEKDKFILSTVLEADAL